MSLGSRRVLVPTALALSLCGCNMFESSTEVPAEKASCVEDLEAAKQAKFDVDPELASRIRATLIGTVVLQQGADKADQDLALLCDGLARELGGETKETSEEPGQQAKASCELTVAQIRGAREKAGATLVTDLKNPFCNARTSDFESCARDCDPNLEPGFKAACAPEATSGRCESKCTGTCVEQGSADCDATCRGSCEGRCMEGFFGRCGGKCIGDCDGKTSSGKCEGTCDGKCTSDASGVCEGKCDGKCAGSCLTQMKSGECEGSCMGSCKEPFSDLRCAEVIAPEEMAPECRAECDAQLASRLTCSAGHADVTVFSAAERDKAEQLRASLSRALGSVLTIEQGNVAQLERASAGLQSSTAALEEAAADHPKLAESLKSCLSAAKEKQEKATATLETFATTSTQLVEATKH